MRCLSFGRLPKALAQKAVFRALMRQVCGWCDRKNTFLHCSAIVFVPRFYQRGLEVLGVGAAGPQGTEPASRCQRGNKEGNAMKRLLLSVVAAAGLMVVAAVPAAAQTFTVNGAVTNGELLILVGQSADRAAFWFNEAP